MVGACLIEESVLADGTNLQRVDQIPQKICPPPPNQISRGRIIYSPGNLFHQTNFPWDKNVKCPVTDLMHVHHGPDKGPERGQGEGQNG